MSESTFIDWLLQSSTPSIRYQTLTRLLDLPETDPSVHLVWHTMQAEGPIPAILEKQSETGAWTGERSFYTPKYTSTHWSMLLMVELGADPADPRLQRGARSVLDAQKQTVSRGSTKICMGCPVFGAICCVTQFTAGYRMIHAWKKCSVRSLGKCRPAGAADTTAKRLAPGVQDAPVGLRRFARCNENPRCAGCHPKRLPSPIE